MVLDLKNTSLSFVLIVIGILTIVSGALVPLYSDEIAMHLYHSRFVYNDFMLVGLFPQCESDWVRDPRWYEYPALIIYSIIYPSSNLLLLRFAGVFWALVNFILLLFLCKKLVPIRAVYINLFAFVLALLSLGVLPYVLILARPEQQLLMCLLLFVLLSFFYPLRFSEVKKINISKCIIFLLVVCNFYFAHPKAIFYAPFVFFCVYFYTYAGSIGLRLITLFVFTVITCQATFFAKYSTKCTESPVVKQVLSEHVNNFATWDLSFYPFVSRMSSHIQFAFERLSSRFLFQTSYQSEWLPGVDGGQLGKVSIALNWIFHNSIVYFVWVVFSFIIIMSIRQILRRGDIKRYVLAISLLFAVLVNSAIYSLDAWSFYTPGLIIPVLLLALLLVIPDFLALMRNRLQFLYLLALPLYLLAIVSMFNLVNIVFPQLYDSVQNGSLIVPRQKISTPIALNSDSSSILNSLIDQCGIPMYRANRVAVDGVAYGFLQAMRQPINILYVYHLGYGKDIKDLGAFLSAKGSDGILSRCEYLSPSLLQRAIEMNAMCCVSRHALIK